MRADWQYLENIYDETILFEAQPTPYPHHWEVHFNFSIGHRVIFSFDTSDVIEFWISDKENYDAFKVSIGDSYPYLCYSIYSYQVPITEFAGAFEIPKTDEWYFVFVNEYPPTENRTIHLTVDLYQWDAPFNPALFRGPILMSIGLIATIAVLIGGFIYSRRRTKQTD